MRIRTLMISVIASAPLVLLLSPSYADASATPMQTEYSLVELALPAGYRAGQATGLNAGGQIAGAVFIPDMIQPTIWPTPSDVRLLRLPQGAIGGAATDINDSGEIVGYARAQDGQDHAVMWTGDKHKPRWLEEPAGTVQSYAQSINPAGDAAGLVLSLEGERAAVWPDAVKRRGKVAPLTGPVGSVVFDINAGLLTAGAQVVKDTGDLTAFTWVPGQTPTELKSVLAGGDAIARALNDDGLVVGFSDTEQGIQAVTWIEGESRVLPLPPGKARSQAWNVNSNGDIVGRAASEAFDALVPVLWTTAGVQQLPSLGDAAWQHADAMAINDAGMVIGFYEEVGGPELRMVPLAWLPK